MQTQMQIVFPLMLTLMATSGSAVSAAVCRPAVGFFSTNIVSVICSVVYPITIAILVFSMAGNIILLMFYTTVSAWMVKYFYMTASGSLTGLDNAGIGAAFGGMLSDPVSLTLVVLGIMIVATVVCLLGVKGSLEKVTKFMMLALLGVMLILAVNSIFLDGAKEGLAFYLIPNVDNVKEAGLANVIVGAMNQAFFTLSLGMGGMAIFGSYIGKDRALLGEAVNVAALDTFVAFTSGLIIFPACYAYGVQPDAGPSLIFQTLPNVFNNMPGGRIWGSLFFLFMIFAAMSTVFGVLENIIACLEDLTGWSRKTCSIVSGIGVFVLSLPCILGFNVWSSFVPFAEGSGVLDLEDFVVSNLILPLGSLTMVLFCVITRYGWGWKNFVAEANHGRGLKVANWMRWIVTIVLPIIIITMFIMGLVNFNFG